MKRQWASLEVHQLIVRGITLLLVKSLSSSSSFNNHLVDWISYLLERDQESSTSSPVTSSAPVTSAPSQSSPVHGAPTPTDQLIGTFDEFDPQSSVTGTKNSISFLLLTSG